MTHEQMMNLSKEELVALLATKSAGKELTFKVSGKGGVSVYNLNARFPVTLYEDQWNRLIAAIPALQKFMAANKASLTHKV